MKLLVQVDPRRDREGSLTLYDDGNRVALGPVPVCATADAALARRMQNASCDPMRPGGHAPFGTYRLAKIDALDASERSERGPYALAFEPVAGDALHAESFGRLLLDLHGGARGSDGRLRATGGSLRVEDNVVEELARRLSGQLDRCELLVQAVKESWWSRFFRGRRALSDDRETSWRSHDSDSSEPAYSGHGGQFAGAGASGSWDSAAPAIAAAATGAAVVAAVAAASEPSASDAAAAEVGATDTATHAEADSADGTAADSGDSSTAATTSY